MADDAAKLIDHLGIGPCFVAGLSLGAFITQELALARPDLVRGAAMMGTLGRLDTFRRALFNAWVELDQSGIKIPRMYDAVYSGFELFSPRALDDDEGIGLYLEATASFPEWTGPGRLGQHMADAGYDKRLEALSHVHVPSMVLAFELDMVTPRRLGREVAETIPGCKYVEVAGVGHGGPFEEPDQINKVLIDFFMTI